MNILFRHLIIDNYLLGTNGKCWDLEIFCTGFYNRAGEKNVIEITVIPPGDSRTTVPETTTTIHPVHLPDEATETRVVKTT